MQDPMIVDRLIRGDGGALKSLFKATSDRLYALAFRLTGDEEKARESVLRSFEELWEKRAALDPLAHLEGLLFRETFVRLTEAQPGDAPQVFVPDVLNEHLEPLVDALREMEAIPRLVYLLVSVDGFNQREVARTIDVPVDSVQVYFARALESLDEVVQQGVF